MNIPIRGVAAVRVCIAPDRFDGDLTAPEAAAAMARGVERAAQELDIKVRIDACPVASGGAGTLDALAVAAAFKPEDDEVEGPLGEPVTGRWGRVRKKRSRLVTATTLFVQAVLIIWLTLMYTAYLLLFGGRRSVAVVDSASVVGPGLAPDGRRDPSRHSTYGLGRLIRLAFRARSKRVVIALGESASCDGGVGMAAGLGVKFYDHDGALIERPTGADLRLIGRIDPAGIDPGINGAKLFAACAVDSPLTGTHGAARKHAPTQGATPEQIEDLDLGLEALVRLCKEAGLDADPDAPGAGAGGGLGFALATFCGATLRPGAETVLELIRFQSRIESADLVLTGAGRFDSETLRGSAPLAVATTAARQGVPVIALAGRVGAPFDASRSHRCEDWEIPTDDADLFERVTPIPGAGEPGESTGGVTPELLEQAALEAVRGWLTG